MRVLAVFAHPDDMEVHCGGTIRKLALQGHEILEIILSRGDNGGRAEVREKEARRGAEILGVEEVVFLDHEDGRITVDPESIDVLREYLREYRPELVFTHSPRDTHQDHRRTYRLVTAAVSKFPEISVLMGEGPSTTEFNPVLYVDISDVIEEKLEAVRAHESQIRRGAISEDHVLRTAGYWGAKIGVKHAEAFEAFRLREGLLLR